MGAGLQFNPGWDEQVFRQEPMKLLVAKTVARLAELAIESAPATRKSNWNKIKKNISADVSLGPSGWYGHVIIEDNEEVRHAMLQERGWTDKRGRRHPGRFYLKKALEKGRV